MHPARPTLVQVTENSDDHRPIRVVIADDQRLVRTGFRVILNADGIDVVGEAADGVEAVEQAVALRPDVVLMDVRMPKLDGLQATRHVLARTSCRVLILTTFDSDEYVYEALRARGPAGSCSRTRRPSSCWPRCAASPPATR